MTQQDLGIGIIGVGWFATMHATAIGEVPGVRLVAASGRTVTRLDQFTARYGGTGYPDYRELPRDPAVDAVCVTAPNRLHAEMAVAALDAGKAVLMEKPMAATVAECDQIVAAVERTGVPFMVAHNYRFLPMYAEAKRLVAGGEIGDPVICTATMAKGWGIEKRQPWHLAEGGGMWLTNAVHLVDRLSWLLDSAPRDVRAQIGTRFHEQEADDVGVAFITFDSGAVGLLRAVGYRVGVDDQWTEIQGTAGALRVSHRDGLMIGRDDRWQQIFPPDPDAMKTGLRAEWTAFRDYVRDGGPSPIPATYGRLVVATIEAGFESSKTGQVVKV
jgi:phthalate 4,5-cis-dihydrodiol dehydrogenase